MSVPVIAFFNNKGGIGKTSLVYHVAWMMSELGLRVVATDLDPQGNLSAAFLDEEKMEALWGDEEKERKSIYGAIFPLKDGVGDVTSPHMETLSDHLDLIPGDMLLSTFEDDLSDAWPKCLNGDSRSFRVSSAFWRVMQKGAAARRANVILLDLGPNLGAINRASIVASDFLVVPLGPDLFSLQGLRNLGPTLANWRVGWRDRLAKNKTEDLVLPQGNIHPSGYVVMQHSVYGKRPVKSYDKWIGRIPDTYRKYVLGEANAQTLSIASDPHCFSLLKHYRSLMPMAQEAGKPIFHLKAADGAIGAHYHNVQHASQAFQNLSREIAKRAGIAIPE